MKMTWDDERSMRLEELARCLGVSVQWMRNMSSDEPGPTLTDEEPEDEDLQLDFDELWAEKLRSRYGIAKPFAD